MHTLYPRYQGVRYMMVLTYRTSYYLEQLERAEIEGASG
jgi:hypothetical protein